MKQNGLMKIVILILVFLLAGVSVWVAWDEINGRQQRRPVEIPETMVRETERMGEPQVEAGTVAAESVPPETTVPEKTQAPRAASLLFAGDVLLSNHVLNAYDKAGGITGVLDEKIRDQIAQADLFMVNQEFPFSDRGTAAADKQYTFRLPPSKISIFQEMGIDLVTLANNHILDFGTDGLQDSCETLDGAGIPYVGAGPDLERAKKLETVELQGGTVGFLGLSRVYMDSSWAASGGRPGVFSTYDSKLPVEEIKKARDACDYLVVYVHWGVERETMPEDYQRTLAKAYIDAGADLVVGSHPHVLQGLEYYKGKPIVYSLGNFVFGSSIPETALLKVEWDQNQEEARLWLIPCTSSVGYTKMVTEEAKVAAFYEKMTGLSFGVQIESDGRVVESR